MILSLKNSGLAILFDRSGGKITPEMAEVIDEAELKDNHGKRLIKEIREIWNEWDLQEEKQNDDQLKFESFYNGFMAPYFGCFACETTTKAFKAIGIRIALKK